MHGSSNVFFNSHALQSDALSLFEIAFFEVCSTNTRDYASHLNKAFSRKYRKATHPLKYHTPRQLSQTKSPGTVLPLKSFLRISRVAGLAMAGRWAHEKKPLGQRTQMGAEPLDSAVHTKPLHRLQAQRTSINFQLHVFIIRRLQTGRIWVDPVMARCARNLLNPSCYDCVLFMSRMVFPKFIHLA